MSKRRPNNGGRNSSTEHWTKILKPTMQTDAWRALSSTAQALYPWLKLEWRGPDANNNGRIRLPVRSAAKCLGVGRDTAARAFRDLQAKGFLVATEAPRLGDTGSATSPSFELTELALPGSQKEGPRKLFLKWTKGNDYPVLKVMAHNPKGRNGKKTLSSKSGRVRHQNDDKSANAVIKIRTACHQNDDGIGRNQADPVIKTMTSLSYQGGRASEATPSAANQKGQREGERGIPTIDHDTLEEISDSIGFVSMHEAAQAMVAHLEARQGFHTAPNDETKLNWKKHGKQQRHSTADSQTILSGDQAEQGCVVDYAGYTRPIQADRDEDRRTLRQSNSNRLRQSTGC